MQRVLLRWRKSVKLRRLGHDVQGSGKYFMGPADEHVSFFKQLSVVVSSQLKYHQFRELLGQKATDSCTRNIGIRIIILNDFLCGTAWQVIIYFLEVPVEKVIKSHMKQFLSVNNPAPAKESMALRVTIALIDSEVKVTKKTTNNLLLWGMQIKAEKHGELLWNKLSRRVAPFSLSWP